MRTTLHNFVFYVSIATKLSFLFPTHTNTCRFLSNVASQLTCYLLQLVYRIICSSIASGIVQPNDDGAAAASDMVDAGLPDSKDNSIAYVTAVFVNKHDLINSSSTEPHGDERRENVAAAISPTVVSTKRSDITTIVALREFLLHGIGGRILEVLLCVDTMNMLCARELTSLLVNLFPTNPWSSSSNAVVGAAREKMDDFLSLDDAIGRLASVRSKPSRLSYLEKWFVIICFLIL